MIPRIVRPANATPAGSGGRGSARRAAVHRRRSPCWSGRRAASRRTERRLALDFGFRPVRLGPRILRTETAPLAALAVLQFLAGDF